MNEDFAGVLGFDKSLNPGEIYISISNISDISPGEKVFTDYKDFSQFLLVKDRIVKFRISFESEKTSEFYKIISEFSNLRELFINSKSPFRDEDAELISKLNYLEQIIITNAFVTGKTLKAFGKLENIKEIKNGWYLTKEYERNRYNEGEYRNNTI
ncbi:MAG: hypothetical protein KBH06_06325 [Spirochaetes bacterium]|nr:hypothetical protein [Spirochaetota bacterium]